MSFTVTATQGGATSNGLLLRVKVLTGTALTQGGATLAPVPNAVHGSITTTTAGSLVYGALSGDAAVGAFVAEPSCTLIDNFHDTANGEYYGSFVTTSATGTPGSTLVGSTTSNANPDMAAVEILANGTITEDASGPAVATVTGATTVTTASFTPPAGSLLVAMIGSDGAANGSTLTTMTVTDTSGLGLTWTQVISQATTGSCYAGVWLAQMPALIVTPATHDQVSAVSGVATSTHSISPAAGSLVRWCVAWLNSNDTLGLTFTATDSNSVSYGAPTRKGNPGDADGGCYLLVWDHVYTSAPGAITLTVTASGAGVAAAAPSDCLIQPYVITGQASDQSTAAFAHFEESGTPTTTYEIALTPTVLNSAVFGLGAPNHNGGATGPVTAIASTVTDVDWDDGTVGSRGTLGRSATLTSALTSTTYGWTSANPSPFGYGVMVSEVVPVSSGGSPTITTTSLPLAQEGSAYSATLAATGGATPYTWSISSGSLPGWASLNSSTGVISGTVPGTAGSTTFTAEVTDNASATATQSLTLVVTQAELGAPAIPGRARPGNFIPGQVNVASTSTTVNAGLAHGTGTASLIYATIPSGLSHAAGTASVIYATIPAGLAHATGTASLIYAPVQAGLATATGTASVIYATVQAVLSTAIGQAQPAYATIPAGLASGTGSALSPPVPAGLATAAGTAQPAYATIPAGLATGTGTSQPAYATIPAGLAHATGTSQPAYATIPAGLATSAGTSQPAYATIPAGLAHTTGTAFDATVSTVNSDTAPAGLATGTGTAQPAYATIPAGLATSTGTAQPAYATIPAGLAHATGTAQPAYATVPAGLAHALGAAQPAYVTIPAGLAHATGTSQPAYATIPAGLATGTGTAQPAYASIPAGLAAAAGAAYDAAVPRGRKNVDYTGSTLSSPNTLGGTVAVATLDGTLSVAVNTLGGTASVNSNTLGGTVSVAALGGTASVTSDTLTGTLSVVVNPLSGTDVTDKMQEVDITLNEFNDATVTFQIKNNGSPMDITGMTVNALFKKTRGDLDSAVTTKTYSSGGGSPAITIVTPSTGSCSLAIPDADLVDPSVNSPVFSFYRIDVVNGIATTTAIFGTVTITLL